MIIMYLYVPMLRNLLTSCNTKFLLQLHKIVEGLVLKISLSYAPVLIKSNKKIINIGVTLSDRFSGNVTDAHTMVVALLTQPNRAKKY